MPSNNVQSVLMDLQRNYPPDTENGDLARPAKNLLLAQCTLVQEVVANVLQLSSPSIRPILKACVRVRTHFDNVSGALWPHILADFSEECDKEGATGKVAMALALLSKDAQFAPLNVGQEVSVILRGRKRNRDQKKYDKLCQAAKPATPQQLP